MNLERDAIPPGPSWVLALPLDDANVYVDRDREARRQHRYGF